MKNMELIYNWCVLGYSVDEIVKFSMFSLIAY